MEDYNYKRELNGVTDQWHKIILPDNIFAKLSQNLSDIRIYGITATGDTIEAPYLLNTVSEKVSTKNIDFKSLNKSHTDEGYFYTFEVREQESINQILLDFDQDNFNWQIKLEGSTEQIEWFTIIEDYRILSIKNQETNFKYTKLTFPESNYGFYRMFINAEKSPDLNRVSIKQQKKESGKNNTYPVNAWTSNENKKLKQTEIDIDLKTSLPISSIKINVDEGIDYYRPLSIKYISDSIETEKGWKYNYQTLSTEILNSSNENLFQFPSTILQKMRLIIHNRDNQPLTISSIEARANVHEVLARFNTPAKYYFTYGSPIANKPQYDILQFVDNIPDSISTLEMGEKLIISKPETSKSSPLFSDKRWLWAIMGIVIVLLGGLTVKMMKRA